MNISTLLSGIIFIISFVAYIVISQRNIKEREECLREIKEDIETLKKEVLQLKANQER